MMGFYLILGAGESLADIAPRIGTICPCAAYYRPLQGVTPGEAYEVHAESGAKSETLLISTATHVEEDVQRLLHSRFPTDPIRVYQLTYSDPVFFKRLARIILNRPNTWVIDDADGVVSSPDFLSHLKLI